MPGLIDFVRENRVSIQSALVNRVVIAYNSRPKIFTRIIGDKKNGFRAYFFYRKA